VFPYALNYRCQTLC